MRLRLCTTAVVEHRVLQINVYNRKSKIGKESLQSIQSWGPKALTITRMAQLHHHKVLPHAVSGTTVVIMCHLSKHPLRTKVC